MVSDGQTIIKKISMPNETLPRLFLYQFLSIPFSRVQNHLFDHVFSNGRFWQLRGTAALQLSWPYSFNPVCFRFTLALPHRRAKIHLGLVYVGPVEPFWLPVVP